MSITPIQRKLNLISTGSGRPLADVTELWSERAAIREYVGGASRADAERDALDDVAAWFGGSNTREDRARWLAELLPGL